MRSSGSGEVVLETAAPCGLYCGVCRLYTATQANDLKLLGRMARVYSRVLENVDDLQAEDLLCDGCFSDRLSFFCRECRIRDCVSERNLDGCHRCDEFACDLIDQFSIPVSRQVIMRTVPFRREHGTEAWMRVEEARYRCPECKGLTFRGAEWCPHCRTRVSLD